MDLLADPNWPGPNYYDDCKKFEWKQVLVKNHKAFYIKRGLTYPDYKKLQEKEDADALQKLYARLEGKWFNISFAAGIAQILYFSSF